MHGARISRRRFLQAAGAGAASVAYLPAVALGRDRAARQTIVLSGAARHVGQYLYLPFEVPRGVNRVEVSVTKQGDARIGVGLFDQRGPHYQSAGFRGVYGEERSQFFVTAHEASQSFLPGPIEPGVWTVLVAVFRVAVPTAVTATVALNFGPPSLARRPEPVPEVVSYEPGWYRGDLHCHTPESSDAWASGSALTPAAWAETTRALGLDFLAMTDHNVVSQNLGLASAAGGDVLLLAGEEMTNWFHGHATVCGIDVGDWLDWRQTPAGLPLPSGYLPGGEPAVRIGRFLATVREMGGFVSAAHPLLAHLSWQFLAEGDLDPAARTDALEVWSGQFTPDDEASLAAWDDRLRRGWRVWANGGSDLHGVRNTWGLQAGTPTTVVYARQLSRTAVVEALRAGRCFVTRRPDGVELYLRAQGPGGQRQIVGGTIYGGPADRVELEVLVRRAAGMRLLLLRDGAPVCLTGITAEEQRVALAVPIGPGGYVRAEVRSAPEVDPANPVAGRTDMEAFTNPVFLAAGSPPADIEPIDAPPGPPGPRRPAGPGARRLVAGPSLAPEQALAALTVATARAGGCGCAHGHSRSHA